jgi:hypothetical protein
VKGLLYLRLRNALGLSAVAVGSLGSGPCGTCSGGDEVTSCVTLEKYRTWLAMQDGEGGAAGAAEAGTAGLEESAGASGRTQVCPSTQDFEEYWRGTHADYSGPDVTWSGEIAGYAGSSPPSDGGDLCCYRGETKLDCAGGRPFLIDGQVTVAALEKLGEVDAAHVLPCDGLVVGALVEAWLFAARMEHASVASFARFTLGLLAHGAPLSLVEAAQRAGLDELRHAELCLAQAHRYTTQRFRFGPLRIAGSTEPKVDLAEFVTRNIVEGCVGETVAAAVMAEQARAASDRELADALRGVADDESNHAALAWKVLQWALTVERGEIRDVAERAFSSAYVAARNSHSMPVDNGPELAAHGQLGRSAQLAIAYGAWKDVIAPLERELLWNASSSTQEWRAAIARV